MAAVCFPGPPAGRRINHAYMLVREGKWPYPGKLFCYTHCIHGYAAVVSIALFANFSGSRKRVILKNSLRCSFMP
jgi:hypothetical protein